MTIPDGQAFCRHCGTYVDKEPDGNVKHLCPDGHLESRLLTGGNPGTSKREVIWTLECGCTIGLAGRWSSREARHAARQCCPYHFQVTCVTHGPTYAVKIEPYLPLYLPVPA